VRLCKRFRRLVARGKHPNVAVTAIARELIAFMWAIAKQMPIATSTAASSRVGVEARPRCTAQPSTTLRGGSGRPSCLDRGRRVDGSQSGGTQPTDLRRINRRCDWPRLGADPGVPSRAFGRAADKEDSREDPDSLDNRSHINVALQPRRAHCCTRRCRLHAVLGASLTSVSTRSAFPVHATNWGG
jgi:hypothetical protein